MNEALANTETPAGAKAGKAQSARVDFCGVGRIQELGAVAAGLRTTTTKKTKRGEREEKDYVIEAALKVLKVLEVLEGRSFEPASLKTVMERTGFNHDFCRRALLTLKAAGFAKQTFDGWIVGHKPLRIASNLLEKGRFK